MGDVPVDDGDTRFLSENDGFFTICRNVNSGFPSSIKRSSADGLDISTVQKKTRLEVVSEQKSYIDAFTTWNEDDQVDFLCQLLSRMSHAQHSQISSLLEPLLQCDIITALPTRGVSNISADILSYLDANSLLAVELVSKGWQTIVVRFQLWRKLIARRIETDHVWRGLAERRGWLPFIHLVDPAILSSLLEQRLSLSSCQQIHKRGLEFTSMKSPNQLSQQPNPFGDNWTSAIPSALISTAADVVPADTSASPTPSFSQSCSHEKMMLAHRFYKQLYPRIIHDIHRINDNWNNGKFRLTRIRCHSDSSKGVYCLQYDSEKIVSGLRDDTIKVWRRVDTTGSAFKTVSFAAGDSPTITPSAGVGTATATLAEGNGVTRVEQVSAGAATSTTTSENNVAVAQPESDGYQCTQVLRGHTGSVLCLQYEGNLLISGSSDSKVRLWDLSTGECLHILDRHHEAVLHLRFRNNVLVTCSKDRNIIVWDMGVQPTDISCRVILGGHRAAVNVVDFDERYIVSASGDRTIKVWRTDTSTHNPVRTLSGHRRGIACLQYRSPYVVSGSSDFTIRIWDVETGACFRVLEGHDELVRCIRFDSKRIVSGAYDGKIKIWDFKAALNPRSRTSQLCIKTLHEHTGRVFRLQFDDFQIVSSSHDDSILIWDFTHLDLNSTSNQEDETGVGENDDGFFNEEAAAAAAGGMPTFPNLRQIRLINSRSPQINGTANNSSNHVYSSSSNAASVGGGSETLGIASQTTGQDLPAPSSSSSNTVVNNPPSINPFSSSVVFPASHRQTEK